MRRVIKSDVSDIPNNRLTRSRVDNRMAKLRQRLDAAVESIRDGFILFDADDRVVLCNTAFRDECRSIERYLEPGTPFEDFLRAMYASDEIVGHEYRTEEKVRQRIRHHNNPELGPWVTQDAKGRWIQINEYKTHDGGTALIRTDVSDRVLAEQEALRAKEQAESANRAKSEFLSSMSHELRTPMNAILGFAQLLEQGATELPPENQETFVGEILRSGHHMLDLINGVLDLAKIESDDVSLDIREQAPRPLIDACLNMVTAPSDQNGITARGQIPEGDLPMVRVDALRLKQALLNLLSNAIKYNRHGGEVVLECNSGANGILHISVSDTGSGIPDDMRDKVFEPFGRLGAENSSIPSTGISLSVTKQLVERMGDTVGFESTVGEGTTFWINLPFASPQVQPAN